MANRVTNNRLWREHSGTRILTCVLVALLSISCLTAFTFPAQNLSNDSIFAARMAEAHAEHLESLPIGKRVVAMGRLFLGTPYVAGTLDTSAYGEHLIVDLHGFDCVTFYENMLALARIVREYRTPTMKDFENELTFLRYRNGKINGFHSRLNYSIDYFYNNQKKGVLRIVTREVGGRYAKYDDRAIDFMTKHRARYKQLANHPAEYAAMLEIESDIHARRGFYYIPKADVAKVESKIETGDILGLTTNIPGLDCSHTGVAVRLSDGRIHFMHASSLQGKVIISKEPLAEYLTHSNEQTGIIVNRPLEVKPKY